MAIPSAGPSANASTTPRIAWHLFVPKLITTLREGYGAGDLRHDFLAGLTVAIVALPLAMALAIASGTTPDKGLITAVVAGFLISALGGSRYQIGGPTGAFVVVIFNVIQTHGYDGLVLATLMAGVMLVIGGLAQLGTWIKYIPEPVTTGFTSGIAVIILSSQVKDFFGLSMASVPVEFTHKWAAYWHARGSLDIATLAVAAGALAIVMAVRRVWPKAPSFLIAMIGAAVVTTSLGLRIDTIGSRFGGIPTTLPDLSFPDVSVARAQALMPSAFTIAFLAGVESLLSAVVADGMTGRRHRSNCELVAQGIANIASALFGGLPATGAIARTATNIRSGARSPISGMLHAVFLLLFMLVLAPLADYVPLAALAAVLVVVAWNMSELERFWLLVRGPGGDRVVLLITFGLTVMVDLTVAIEAGVVLAAMLFMHRMSEVTAISTGGQELFEKDVDDFSVRSGDLAGQRAVLPPGVEVFELRGPLFFGVAGRLSDLLDGLSVTPRVFILRMREVPMMDATGAARLLEFIERCRKRGTRIILAGLQAQPERVLRKMQVLGTHGVDSVSDYAEAVELSRV